MHVKITDFAFVGKDQGQTRFQAFHSSIGAIGHLLRLYICRYNLVLYPRQSPRKRRSDDELLQAFQLPVGSHL